MSGSHGRGVPSPARFCFRCPPVKPKIAAEGQGKVVPGTGAGADQGWAMQNHGMKPQQQLSSGLAPEQHCTRMAIPGSYLLPGMLFLPFLFTNSCSIHLFRAMEPSLPCQKQRQSLKPCSIPQLHSLQSHFSPSFSPPSVAGNGSG